MAIRSKLTASALALALISTTLPAAAGGLGRMHVQSGLGQPFRAEVDITGIRTQDLSKLKVSLAPPSAFAEMQMDYPEVLNSLKVSVSRKADGKLVARVQGSQPISDPFLFLLLELNDDGARIFKEFTALLEPVEGPLPALPVSAEQAKPAANPAPAATPAPAAPAPATPATPAATSPAPVAPAASASKPAPASPPQDSKASNEPLPVAGQHKVKPGETLSGVAARLKPADASLEQMMVGLYRNNSGAFAGNMDKLRAGETLDVPTAASVRAIPPAQALDTVRAQVKDWRNYVLRSADAASASAAQPPSQGKTAPTDASAQVAPADSKQDVLKLSKVEGKPTEPQERAAQLEEELVTREKQLKEAGDRIGVLENQLEEMRSLLALRSQAGAQAQKQAEDNEAAAAGGESKKPASAAAPASASSLGSSDSMVLVGGLSAAAILAAGLAYAHRRQDALKAFFARLLARRPRKPKEDAPADEVLPASVAAVASDASEEDPLQVADRLIEYGKLAQAETVLMAALQKTPDRHELRLKLLKVYYATPLVDKFNAQAARLLDAVSKTSPLWLQALEMGRSLDPNHPLYAAPVVSTPVDAVDFGFDEPDLPPPAPAPVEVAAAKPAPAAPAPAPVEADPFGMDGDDFLLPDDAVMQGGGSFTPDASDIEQEEKPLLNYDFQLENKGKQAEEVKAPPPPPPPASQDFSMDELFDFGDVGTAPAAAAPAAAEAAPKPVAPATPAAIADPVADTLSQNDLDDLFAQPTPASAPAPEPAPVEEAEEELDIDALIAAEQAKQEAEAKAEKAARAAAAAEAAKRLHEDMALDFDGILEDTVPQVPALDLAALAAALEDAPSMDDLPPPDDTVLEAADMPLEMPDDGALAAELAEPIDENAADDNPLKDEMSEPAPPPAMPLSAPDLAFDFDAVFQDAIPAMTPSFDRGALAAALADAPSMDELPDEELPHDDGPIVTPEQVDTKLDLAKVYIDMGDQDGAREILAEVLSEGTDAQRDTAMSLLEKL
ncbi:FimV/HubP family polar landmark protein [Aquaspirillum sp. LM1]|uniref:FimV/HubP family polar landmark protein n=1 Tax=Aquaspirillum sp. LM1 TaxID=1938604 RepID=UPI001C0C2B7F|nr:FimV/HubP family polar landmark protein [Aquaspirillum sp. LM1]